MAVKTTLEQLEEVQTAITGLMSSKTYRMGEVMVERSDLGELQDREDALLARYRREQRGGAWTRLNLSQGL